MKSPAVWTARSPRERALLGGTVAAAALALLFAFAWLPVERDRTRIAAQLPALRASVAEMRAQATEAKELRAMPARATTPLPNLVASGAIVQGLPGVRLTVLDAKRVKLAVDDASWTRLVEWLSALDAAHGLTVDEASIDALPSAGRVRAGVVLAAP